MSPLEDPVFTVADLDAAERDLGSVDRAVALLEEGRYGICSVCGISIAPAVALDPLTFECVEHRSSAAAPAPALHRTAG
jgi:RNA polymerase-binding transcription factor DksA